MPLYIITKPDNTEEQFQSDMVVTEQCGSLCFLEIQGTGQNKAPFHMMTLAPGEWKRVRRSNVMVDFKSGGKLIG